MDIAVDGKVEWISFSFLLDFLYATVFNGSAL
jgi:hypothetical protein